MTDKFQDKYRIEPNRWQFWDYSSPGSYFITICTDEREEILGHIINDTMILSEYGEIVKSEFLNMAGYHKRVFLDEWVIMPNHVHCIISLGNYENPDGAPVEKIHEFSHLKQKIREFSLRGHTPTDSEIKQYRKDRRNMLVPKILGKSQMQSSKKMNILCRSPGVKNWQTDYYDHVIRNENEYLRIKDYIINNPANWDKDKFRRLDK